MLRADDAVADEPVERDRLDLDCLRRPSRVLDDPMSSHVPLRHVQQEVALLVARGDAQRLHARVEVVRDQIEPERAIVRGGRLEGDRGGEPMAPERQDRSRTEVGADVHEHRPGRRSEPVLREPLNGPLQPFHVVAPAVDEEGLTHTPVVRRDEEQLIADSHGKVGRQRRRLREEPRPLRPRRPPRLRVFQGGSSCSPRRPPGPEQAVATEDAGHEGVADHSSARRYQAKRGRHLCYAPAAAAVNLSTAARSPARTRW